MDNWHQTGHFILNVNMVDIAQSLQFRKGEWVVTTRVDFACGCYLGHSGKHFPCDSHEDREIRQELVRPGKED